MSTITATARKWSGGWELEIDDENITQVRVLAKAEQQIRDYLDTLDPDTSHDEWEINVIPEIGAIAEEVRQAKEQTTEAARLQQEAAQRTRKIVQDLRNKQYSVSDIATVLDISRGRVSQLERSGKRQHPDSLEQ